LSLDFELAENTIESMPNIPFKIMMNVGKPGSRLRFPGAAKSRRLALAGVWNLSSTGMIGVSP